MPVIRIDPEVYSSLQERARPFLDSPNDVLRRVLGLDEASSRAKHDPKDNDERGGATIKRISTRAAALSWLDRELASPNSPISVFLVKHNVGQHDFHSSKHHARASKHFEAGESYPGIPVWWLQIPLHWLSRPDDPFPFALLLCQTRPRDLSDFVCLATPLEYLISEYRSGNLDALGSNICLHLSVNDCQYRGYDVKSFDDVRLTMLTGHRPVPFRQFALL